jgi:isopenicillin N synthase-like dioxygenase
LLIGANEPGLEVKDKSGDWIPVSSSYEDIVCNIGDMMQLITDKKLKSTPHRVIKYKTDEINLDIVFHFLCTHRQIRSLNLYSMTMIWVC